MAYQGWRNYESWCVALWLSNEPGSEAWARELVTETLRRTGHISLAGDALKEWLSEQADQETGAHASPFHDLLTHALERVDWIAVAEAVKDEDADADGDAEVADD